MSQEATERAFIVNPFLANHKKYRDAIREQSKSENSDLLTAHQMIFAALISYQNRIQGKKFEPQSEDVIGRMFLVAQFLQGIEFTETAISEGLYTQAANLLKQELETIGAIEEFASDTRKDGKVPRFHGIMKDFGRRYGEYNELAHPTRKGVVESLGTFDDGDKHGPTTIPQFNADLYQRMYGDQAMLMIVLFRQMRELFTKVFGEDWDDAEERLAASAAKILLAEGIIKVKAE